MAPSLSNLKRRTTAIRRGFLARASSLRWRQNSTSDLDLNESDDIVAELPLLEKNTNKTKRKNGWAKKKSKHKDSINSRNLQKGDDLKNLVLNTAVIARTFSEETKSTSSDELFHRRINNNQQRQSRPGDSNNMYEAKSKTESYPVLSSAVRKQNVFVRTEDNDEIETVLESFELQKQAAKLYTRDVLPSCTISGSMLHRNIEQNYKEANSARKTKNRDRDMVVNMAGPGMYQSRMNSDNHYTTSILQSKNHQKDHSAISPKHKFLPHTSDFIKRAAAAQTAEYFSPSSSQEENIPGAIRRTKSSESATSSVSSVTMYSSYQNDPLVRASNSLMDLLHTTDKRKSKPQSMLPNLYEA